MPHTFRNCNNAAAESAMIELRPASDLVRFEASFALWHWILPALLEEIRVRRAAAQFASRKVCGIGQSWLAKLPAPQCSFAATKVPGSIRR